MGQDGGTNARGTALTSYLNVIRHNVQKFAGDPAIWVGDEKCQETPVPVTLLTISGALESTIGTSIFRDRVKVRKYPRRSVQIWGSTAFGALAPVMLFENHGRTRVWCRYLDIIKGHVEAPQQPRRCTISLP